MNILSHLHSLQEEITAFWDESSKYVLVQHVEPSPLQRRAPGATGGLAVRPRQKVLEDVLNMTSTMGKLGKMEIGIWYELQSEMCRRISRTIDKAYGILWVCLSLKLGYIPQLQCVLQFAYYCQTNRKKCGK